VANAAGQAEKYLAEGYKNVTVLSGGVEGWESTGYSVVD